MSEVAHILALWRRARARGEEVCLATVVHVARSSYRKPGARMMLTAGGERAGTISGGCLEAEVSRRAWWLTRNGPAVERYQSSYDEDGEGPAYGLGCGGTLWLLLERDPHTVLAALAASHEDGIPAVVLHRLRSLAGPVGSTVVQEADARRGTVSDEDQGAEELPHAWLERLAPPPRLTIFGAGDDAQPLARFADEIGWRVTVADGRTQLLRAERFPATTRLWPLTYTEPSTERDGCWPANGVEFIPEVESGVSAGEFAVVLTHSYEQDRSLLRALLPAGLRYLGVLGPRHRTARLIGEVAPTLGWTPEQCWSRLHAPVGLDLGTRDPATIALAIAAELQATAAMRRVEVTRLVSEAPDAEPL